MTDLVEIPFGKIPVRYHTHKGDKSVWVLAQQLCGQGPVWLCVWSNHNTGGYTVNTADRKFMNQTIGGQSIRIP